ncbi:unnamed protein product [Urochloa decumbens]|uniref:Uncharacterized protein n=1 Tax=Urochloa decumbens TaxID=240449 RepID=A0ABC8VBX7_9POAL
MDLNVSPMPEADQRQVVKIDYAQDGHVESAVATMRREREERRMKLKREQRDEGSNLHSQYTTRNDDVPQCKSGRHGRVKEAPQGWLECPAVGEAIDKLIPSKVPLDETFNESVPPGKRYSYKQVVNKQRKVGREVSTNCLIIFADCAVVPQAVPIYSLPF